jgi:acyl carrier protein
MTTKEDIIRDYLINELGLDEGLSTQDKIFSSGLLDSMDVVSLLAFLEKKFSVSFNPFSIGLEDFNSIDLMVAGIEKNK